jgi:hypothetical protein
MLRRIVAIAVIAIGFCCLADKSLAQPKTAVKEPTFRSISDALETSVETRPLQEKVKFKTFLEYLDQKLSGQAPLFLDKEAFMAELGADVPDPMEEEVALPGTPARMKGAMALRSALSQIGKGNATYLIRNGMIEITTLRRAAPEVLLGYPITARFDKKPLEDAIEALCEMSGATIVIDPRIGDKAKTPVSATFRNSIALDGAVRLLVEMADLQADVQENVLFITTKPKAGGKQEKTDLDLKNRRLDLAVKDLAKWSGQTVLLDPQFMPGPTPILTPLGGGRVKRIEAAASAGPALVQLGGPPPDPNAEPKDIRITATFKPNVSAKAAAEVIARQANLTVVELDNLLYITHPLMGLGMFGNGKMPQ